MAKSKSQTTGPCLKAGRVLVDPKSCPTLHRSLTRGLALPNDWSKVVELRAQGMDDSADRKARKLMGIQSEPMSEETKVKLREYAEAHKDEIVERRRVKARIRQAVCARR